MLAAVTVKLPHSNTIGDLFLTSQANKPKQQRKVSLLHTVIWGPGTLCTVCFAFLQVIRIRGLQTEVLTGQTKKVSPSLPFTFCLLFFKELIQMYFLFVCFFIYFY